ncbi:MAG: TonB-dependent receptor plug domain-containing protein [Sphingobacteriaceae bacterium]|nr:TonB-dependent receptor plug domain-containing protein [Cytophagaceae bacterium]
MFRVRAAVPFFLSFILLSFALRDDDPAQRIAERFVRYQTAFPHEKVFLHLDRPYYSAGETIWYKAYLLDANTHEADSVSGVLYVELIDASARTVLQMQQLRAEAGYAAGDFALPDSLPAGPYQLRAYTNWMRNFPEEFLFTHDFRVFDARPAEIPPPIAGPIDLQLFPEGGQLTAGFDCRVGFKAIGPDGRGVDVAGTILANDRDTLTAFRSTHLGMGQFTIPIEAGKTYTAVLFNSDGTERRVPLPSVPAAGFGLAVQAFGKEAIRVFVHNAAPQTAAPRELVLLVQQRGVVCFVAKGNTGGRSFSVNVPRSKFPDDGIAHLTLFDAAGNPLAERLVFIRQKRELRVRVQPDKPRYKPREAVTLALTVTDAEGKPAVGNFSLAATDAGQVVAEPQAQTLVSYLLLSSDLHGAVEQPGRYFDLANSEAGVHLDLLMMTQGWRRFVWKEVLADSLPKPHSRFLFEQALSITGTVRRPNGKPFEKKVGLTLLSTPKNALPSFATGEADAEGRFGFYDLDFSDSTTVLVQAIAGKGNRDAVIHFDPFLQPRVSVVRVPFNPVPISPQALAEYQRRSQDWLAIERQLKLSNATLLKGVTVKAKKVDPFESRRIYGQPNTSIKLDQSNPTGAMSILEVIRGRVAGVSVSGAFPNYSVTIRGISSLSGSSQPLFLLDGVPVDLQSLLSIPVSDVDQIDILKGAEAAIFGSQGGNGAIAVLTKRGNPNYDYNQQKTPGVERLKLPGFAPVREFYAPRYDQPKPEYGRPDFRPTLHWAPGLSTDAEGKASVRFFASDAATTVRVDVQGAVSNGKAGAGETMFRVEL